MPFVVDIKDAEQAFPDYKFVRALHPSEQKAAFHVKDKNGTDLCLKLIEYTFSSKAGQQRHYIIEEFVEGQDLSDLIASGTPWSPKRAAEFFAALADGLYALKEKNIVHRDLKPANIRVRSNDVPVIIDFGLSRHLTLPDLTQTIDGAAIGTPIYFAPEQFDGTKHDIDHRTDLFAFGIVLYQAMTGESPFYNTKMTTRAQLRQAVCESDVHLVKASFQKLDPKWRILITRLLERERAKRPADAGVVSRILAKLGTI